MSEPGSVSILLTNLQAGDCSAVDEVFEHFFNRLKSFASTRIAARDRKVVDDEDLAVWAINRLQHELRAGKYSRISNRADAWRFLVSIMERKFIDHLRSENAIKRGGGQVRGESVFEEKDGSRALAKFSHDCGHITDVDFRDMIEAVVRKSRDSVIGEIIVARIAGHTVDEIAQGVGISTASVNRKLRLARNIIAEGEDFGLKKDSNSD